MVKGFVDKGHRVTVLTGKPNYPEGRIFESYKENPDRFVDYFGAKVVRVPMLARGRSSLTLALNYLSFFVLASIIGPLKLRGQKFDSIFACGLSPIMSVIPAIVIGRLKKAPVFVWILDLWPESLRAVGVVNNQRILSLVGLAVSWIYNRSDYLLLQSMQFFDNVKKYCTKNVDSDRLIYFPSWAEDDFSSGEVGASDLISNDDSRLTIVFAGNVGDAQDFPSILKAAEILKNELPLRWVIAGHGRASQWVQEQVVERQLDNVILLGRHPVEKMPALFGAADALFVSLRTNDVFSKTIPGKIQAYLASGKPILAMIDGEAARVIREAKAGLTCPSGDVQGLVDIVRSMAGAAPDERRAMGEAGRKYYRESFSKDRLFERLEQLFYHATRRSS